jgi:superoxide dismutase
MGWRWLVVRSQERLDVRENLSQQTMIFANNDLGIREVRFKHGGPR